MVQTYSVDNPLDHIKTHAFDAFYKDELSIQKWSNSHHFLHSISLPSFVNSGLGALELGRLKNFGIILGLGT